MKDLLFDDENWLGDYNIIPIFKIKIELAYQWVIICFPALLRVYEVDYDYISWAVVMRRSKREGFQFSFGLKQQEESFSARSTPKFPSIEINKPIISGSERKNYANRCETDPIEVRKSPWDLFQDIGGGMQLLQKGGKSKERIAQHRMATLTPCNDTLSIESKDNKSVKSAKSLGEKLIRRGGKTFVEKQTPAVSSAKRQKHCNSLANILELKLESSSPSHKRHQERRGVNPSHFSLGKLGMDTIEDSKSEEKDTLKMEGRFFEGMHNLEFRETKKGAQTFERIGEKEKSKVFKNFLHKPRPTLRIACRPNNNDKIESMSKRSQDAHF